MVFSTCAAMTTKKTRGNVHLASSFEREFLEVEPLPMSLQARAETRQQSQSHEGRNARRGYWKGLARSALVKPKRAKAQR